MEAHAAKRRLRRLPEPGWRVTTSAALAGRHCSLSRGYAGTATGRNVKKRCIGKVQAKKTTVPEAIQPS